MQRESKETKRQNLENVYLPQLNKKKKSKDQACAKEEDHNLLLLNVPCLGWISSQSPETVAGTNQAYKEISSPIIIWWLETLAPKFVKRRLYFTFLDEDPKNKKINVYTDLAKGIRRLNDDFGNEGLNINPTNTFRYVYPVPKSYGSKSVGKNLYTNYSGLCRIPSYIADYTALETQGLVTREKKELSPLVDSKNQIDEQILYRNIVVDNCKNNNACTTNDELASLEDRSLYSIANLLGWNLDVFLQYVAENTWNNFRAANQSQESFRLRAAEDLKSVEALIEEIGYKAAGEGIRNNLKAALIYPSDFYHGDSNQPINVSGIVTGVQTYNTDYSYLNDSPVYGLRVPTLFP